MYHVTPLVLPELSLPLLTKGERILINHLPAGAPSRIVRIFTITDAWWEKDQWYYGCTGPLDEYCSVSEHDMGTLFLPINK